MESSTPPVSGFRKRPKKTAGGKLYRGRFTCHDVQWTGTGQRNDLLATFTITAEELADAAASGLLWTDQDVQRGIQPGVIPPPARELSLADGYPDPRQYVFDAKNADDIVEKLLKGDTIFLSPLVWNLRPGTFDAYWDNTQNSLHLYSGRIYLPDSHHRHQAIIKATGPWRDARKEYPKFSGDRQFKVELYFLSREDEGNYFFDKNQRPKPTAQSKAYDLTTLDDLSMLAKRVIEQSQQLQGNVNRVTDRLTQNNPQVVTLSTLREMMRALAPSARLDIPELQGLALVAAEFFDMLVAVRQELGKLSVSDRREVRQRLLVDAAVMMHGYASLMKEFNEDLAKLGPAEAKKAWADKLTALKADKQYTLHDWHGDFFEKRNPLWRQIGVVKPSKDGTTLTVLNTGAARSECGRALRQLLSVPGSTTDLRFLITR